jgi:hypothetical protein
MLGQTILKEATGLKAQKLKVVDPILGYSDTLTVMDDLDNVTFKTAKWLAFKALRWFKRDHQGKLDLEGFIILKSSPKHYHLVFNAPVSWTKNVHIIAWIAQRIKNRSLNAYVIMQCIKESSTLRIGTKGDKPSPRIVFRYGKQDKQIKSFLKYRTLVFSIRKKLKRDANGQLKSYNRGQCHSRAMRWLDEAQS